MDFIAPVQSWPTGYRLEQRLDREHARVIVKQTRQIQQGQGILRPEAGWASVHEAGDAEPRAIRRRPPTIKVHSNRLDREGPGAYKRMFDLLYL